MPRTDRLILSSLDGSASEDELSEEEVTEEAPSDEGSSCSSENDQSPQPGTSAVKKKRGLQLPPGYESITASSAGTSSVVTALNAEEVRSSDLWVIRLPAGVKPKHVAGLKLDLPALDPNHMDRPQKVGETVVADAEYDIFAQQIPTSSNRATSSSNKHPREVAPETSEVSQFTPLVPDQQPSTQLTKIVIASARLSKVIFFRRRFPKNAGKNTKKSTSILSSRSCGDVQYMSRREQPDGLELRNIPYGATKVDRLNSSSDTHLDQSYVPNVKRARVH